MKTPKILSTRNEDDVELKGRKDVSVADIIERWTDGTLSTSRAIQLSGVENFAELLEAAIVSEIPLRRKMLPHEEIQARIFTELMSEQ